MLIVIIVLLRKYMVVMSQNITMTLNILNTAFNFGLLLLYKAPQWPSGASVHLYTVSLRSILIKGDYSTDQEWEWLWYV